MNKTFVAAIAMAVAFSACQQASEVEEAKGNKELSFHLDFQVDQTEFSRGVLDGFATALEVYDYQDGVIANRISQTSADDDFGSVSFVADFGSHELLFVAHNSTTCTYDYENSSLSFDKVLDTFTYYQTLEVDEETSGSLNVSLGRQVSCLSLKMLDAMPEGAAGMEITIDGYSATLDPKTGIGSAGVEHVRDWAIPTSAIGTSNNLFTVYTFLPDDEDHTVDMTVRLHDSEDENLSYFTLEDVPVKKNRKTIVSGRVVSAGFAPTISLNSAWGDNVDVTF